MCNWELWLSKFILLGISACIEIFIFAIFVIFYSGIDLSSLSASRYSSDDIKIDSVEQQKSKGATFSTTIINWDANNTTAANSDGQNYVPWCTYRTIIISYSLLQAD